MATSRMGGGRRNIVSFYRVSVIKTANVSSKSDQTDRIYSLDFGPL